MVSVTPGTITRILNGETDFKPVLRVRWSQCITYTLTKATFSLQIAGIKNINPSQDTSKPSRYRLSLVDGQSTIQGMLATQLNELAENGSLSEGSVIELSEFISQNLNGQQILVLLSLNIVGRDDSVSGGKMSYSLTQLSPHSFIH